jgi:hypothetical protein
MRYKKEKIEQGKKDIGNTSGCLQLCLWECKM